MRILIAEIDEITLNYYKIVFKDFTVFTTANGTEAVSKFEEETPDIVIVNSRLKNIDGFEVARTIREQNDSVKIVMITANNDNHKKAIASGCNEFYVSPLSQVALLAIVQ